MSLVPEFIFQTIITRGIKTLRNDSKFIDQLFRNLSQKDQEQMRDFIKSNQINLSINYPRSQLSVPAIVVLLKNENESTAYLSDSMGIEIPEEFSYDDYTNDIPEVLGGTSTTTSTGTPIGQIVFGPHLVLTGTNNTITVSDKTFISSDYITKPHTVHIIQGTGSGQQRNIVANSHNTLMVSPNWTAIPDNTSVFVIRESATEVLGEPSKLYNRQDGSLANSLERRGALYTNRYQIQLVANTQEQTIYLYTILKAIFTLSRQFMEGQGIINFKMSGTDFINRSEYIPDFAFMRALNIEFEHPFDIYEQLTGLADSFTLTLCEEGVDLITSTPTVIGKKASAITGP